MLRLVWRGIRAPTYWQRWSERFGGSPDLSNTAPIIWIHAVSVGEVEASRPLINKLKTAYPHHRLLITTMTPTGSDRVKLLFTRSVSHCYLPYDLPCAIKCFLNKTKPQFGIVMETEIWPNLLAICSQKNIPLVLANARMSARSAKGYAYMSGLIKTTLQAFSLIAAQSKQDYQRFQQLGADSEHLYTVGNLKYEINLPAGLKEQAEAMRDIWGNHRQVFIAASTHEGEDNIVLEAYGKMQATCPDLLLIIVPRHPERFDRVTTLVEQAGYKNLSRSENRPCLPDIQVLIVDTMGELPLFYAASDIAFVGGSLVPHGGHNLLEPAALSKAVITGLHCFNFQEMVSQFLAEGALLQISDSKDLSATVLSLLENSQKRSEMGEAGLRLIAHNQGASQRLVDLIGRDITPHVH